MIHNNGNQIIEVGGVNKISDSTATVFQYFKPVPTPVDWSTEYLTFEAIDAGTFSFSNTINYSLDGGDTWTSLAGGTPTPTVNAGGKICFKAELTPAFASGSGSFASTGRYNVMGNIMSLLYGDNFVGQVGFDGKEEAFRSMFFNNGGLISAENLILPATTLEWGCYFQMFQRCSSLINPPELPATTLAESCYFSMFDYCTSLTTAPELPATTLATECYRLMFQACTSLTTAPELPARTLVNGCYDMMLNYCLSLNYIKMLATNVSASNCLNFWVGSVPAGGTFVKAASANIPRGENGIPNGWTVINA